ncbi:hypothetical protein [Spirosoma sp.]
MAKSNSVQLSRWVVDPEEAGDELEASVLKMNACLLDGKSFGSVGR